MSRPFEQVYTVNDFWDMPRAGVADLDGAPHVYRSIWRDDIDDWDPDNRFELSPLPPEILALVLEDWAIWRRWEDAYYAHQTTDTTHPALPGDRDRHNKLAPIVEKALEIDPSARRVAIGTFRARGGGSIHSSIPGPRPPLEVRWDLVESCGVAA